MNLESLQLLSSTVVSQIHQKISVIFSYRLMLIVLQISLRDPLRRGAEDDELREIIAAAVCTSSDYYC